MNEYLLLMRLDLLSKEAQPSPEQLDLYMKQYHEWINDISAKNQFLGGTGLSPEGKVLKSGNLVTDGPFAEIKESLAGFIRITAGSLNEAADIASRCPILQGAGNSVEVRPISNRHAPESPAS